MQIVTCLSSQVLRILWDNSPADKDVFVAFDGSDNLHTFLVNPDDTDGISCKRLGQTKVGAGQFPVLLLAGEVSLQVRNSPPGSVVERVPIHGRVFI
jgi:hypothetical protein